MSREHGPVLPLEQRCVRPGYWQIEGWQVRRHGPARRPLYWEAEYDEDTRITRATLAAVRDEIRNRTGD